MSSLQFPLSQLIVPLTLKTGSGNSGILSRPLGDCIEFILDVAAGGVGAMDVSVQITPDNTTFYPVLRFTPVVAALAVQERLSLHTIQGQGEAATSAILSATGAVAVANQIITRNYRVSWLSAAPTDTHTFQVWLITQPKTPGGY